MSLSSVFLKQPIAHRGLHGHKIDENSRAAVRQAIFNGFGVELDVQGISDGSPLVFHDAFLDRLTNEKGELKYISHRESTQINLINGEILPELGEMLSLINGKVPILLEVKDQNGILDPPNSNFLEKIVQLINNYQGPLALMSFNPYTVKALQKLAPKIPRGLVTDDFYTPEWDFVNPEKKKILTEMKFLSKLRLNFLSHNFKKIHSPQINIARSEGLPLLCWTVRSKLEEREARETFDNITFEGYLPDQQV